MKTITMTTLFIFLIFGCQNSQKNETTQSEMDIVTAMDDFHHVLRPLMHQSLDDKDVDAFKQNAQALVERAQKINGAQVPDKFADDTEKINELSGSLLAKTKTFREICAAGSAEEIFEAFLAAHDEFEVLADIVYDMEHH